MSDEKLFEVNGTREGKPLTADEAMHVIACKARAVNYTWGTAQSVCDLPRFEEAREAIRAAFHQAQTTLFNNILCEELLAEEGLIASDAYRLAFNSAQRRLQEAETEAQTPVNPLTVPEYVQCLRGMDDNIAHPGHDADLSAMTDDEVRDWLEAYGDLLERADYYTGHWCELSIPPMDSIDLPRRTITLLAHDEGQADRSTALRNTAAEWQKKILSCLNGGEHSET